jgi:hypothetical protein
MKPSLLALIGALVLSAGAAVAVAGVPGDTDPDLGMIIEVTPTTSTLAIPATTLPAPAPAPVENAAPTTAASTTEPTSPPAPEITPEDDLVPRDELTVVVANAANRSGLATQTVGRLSTLGYRNPRPADSNTRPPVTAYHTEGLEAEALRLLDDLGLVMGTIAPRDQAPATQPGNDAQLLLVIGTDAP